MAGGRRRALPLDGRAALPDDAIRFLHSPRARPTGPSASSTRSRASPPPTSAGRWARPPLGSAERPRLRLQPPAASSARSPSSRLTTTPSACRGSSPGARPPRTAPAGRSPGSPLRRRASRRTRGRRRRPRLPARAQPVRAQLRGRLRARRPDPSAPLGLGVRRRRCRPGAVVGGPAPIDQIRGQGVHGPRAAFDSSFASYEDRRADYVTSEPALDYAASSILLLATLEGGC